MKISKLIPTIKDAIWGGTTLKEKYGKKTDNDRIAETWELSFDEKNPCYLEDGTPLYKAVTQKELGKRRKDFERFPMLIKLIDAKNDLSIQVHPNDYYAKKMGAEYGKNETWYIVSAEEGAGVYVGFKRDVTREEVEEAIKNNTIVSLLNFRKVKSGDSICIPPGTVHAIGKGCLIYEIQQNCDITFRVYDYDRTDANGNKRELHVAQALDVMDFTAYNPKPIAIKSDGRVVFATHRCFTAGTMKIEGRRICYTDKVSFKCYTCIEGEGNVEDIYFKAGDTFFVPASYGRYAIYGYSKLIVAEMRAYIYNAEFLEEGGFVFELLDNKNRVLASHKIADIFPEDVEKVDEFTYEVMQKALSKVHLSPRQLK